MVKTVCIVPRLRTKSFTFEELKDCRSLFRLMAVVNSVKQLNNIWATAQNRIDLDFSMHTFPHILNSLLGFEYGFSPLKSVFLYDSRLSVAHINCFVDNTLRSSTDLQVHACLILENLIVRRIAELKLVVESALITQRLVQADLGIVLRQL